MNTEVQGEDQSLWGSVLGAGQTFPPRVLRDTPAHAFDFHKLVSVFPNGKRSFWLREEKVLRKRGQEKRPGGPGEMEVVERGCIGMC